MAGKTTTLAIRIVSDASQASAGFAEAEKRVGGFQRNLDRASVAATGVLVGMGALATQAFQAASDLQQSTGAIDSVFGDWALDIEQAAQKAADAVGLSTSAYENMASTLGAQLKNMGFNVGDASNKTQDLIKLGADLAATFGGTTSDAVEALSSLLRGETDPIERYGVSIKQSDISARLAAEGLDKLEGPALRAAQAQAVLGLLSDQTGAAVGSFGREADTAAGQTQRAQAAFDNAKASLGEALLPVVTDAAQKLSELATWASENKTTVEALAIGVGTLAAAVLLTNGAIAAWQAITALATAAQWLWNAAMSANPLGIILVTIGLVVAAIVWLVEKFGGIGTIVKATGKVFGDIFGWIKDNVLQPVLDVIQWIADKLSWIGDAASWVGDLFSAPAGGGGGGGSPAAAVFGASAGGGAPMRGASLGGLGGGLGPVAAQASAPTMVVNVTVNGAVLDPVGVGRQITQVLRDYARSTGRQVVAPL